MAPQASADRATVSVFCIYAPDDAAQVQKLEQHLTPLQRQGRLILRHQGQIIGGQDRAEVLKAWQAQASMILLLVSPAFLADDDCHEQTQQAMQQRSAQVIPVLMRPCHWSDTMFAGLQCLPRNEQPITTWPNQDEAWDEVVKGIRRVLDELSPSGPSVSLPSSSPAIWNVPFARNPFFTGRDELLDQLHTELQTTQTQAISGLGGIGKTQIAAEYAFRYGKKYRAVLWARAETTETLNASYTEIAGLLNLPQKDVKEQQVIIQAVKDWLSREAGWLFILDNADEPEVLTSFVPPRVAGQVLVTTRASTDLTGLGLGFGHALTVETFTDEVGALFLLHRSGLLASDATLEQAERETQQRARAITQELGGLPLALDQAGT